MAFHDCSRAAALGLLGTVGASALLPARALAQATTRRLIDVHHHFFPRELLDVMNAYQAKIGEPPAGGPIGGWSIDRTLEEMDRTGIQTAILSLASPRGVWFGVDADARKRLSRTCNEFAAAAARQHPGRFGLFASVPLPDVDAGLAEAAYALDTLKADGIGVPTSWGDVWPGDARFAAFWDEMDRRGALVVFHPYAPNCCTNLAKPVPESFLEYPYDTGRAVLSLLTNGSLLKYRKIRWMIPHAGGTLPMMAGRIAALGPAVDRQHFATYAPEGVDVLLKRFYFDTANAFSAPSMAALLAYAAADRIIFGTDYPYVSGTANANGIEALKLPSATLTAIQRGNALKLLPRLAV